jgi:phosphoglycerate dehydrogenase-like enzyme
LDHLVPSERGTFDVLVTWPGFDPDDPATGCRLTDAGCRLRMAPKLGHREPAELIELLDGVRAAIVSTDPFAADVLAAAPALRLIARVGVGTDSIDIEAATGHGIGVCTTPGANASATADHTVALMLAALRRIPEHDRAVRAREWPRGAEATPWELTGATVGIVGFGSIGRLVAERVRGFGARVLVADPRFRDGVALEELLAASDVVTLHAPLTDDTVALLDAGRLALMRPGAVLVNTARGGLVDEDALVDALERGRLRAAALDVFAHEPPVSERLLALPSTVLSPHLGGVSDRSVAAMTELATSAVLTLRAGGIPDGLVNPAALDGAGAVR